MAAKKTPKSQTPPSKAPSKRKPTTVLDMREPKSASTKLAEAIEPSAEAKKKLPAASLEALRRELALQYRDNPELNATGWRAVKADITALFLQNEEELQLPPRDEQQLARIDRAYTELAADQAAQRAALDLSDPLEQLSGRAFTRALIGAARGPVSSRHPESYNRALAGELVYPASSYVPAPMPARAPSAPAHVMAAVDKLVSSRRFATPPPQSLPPPVAIMPHTAAPSRTFVDAQRSFVEAPTAPRQPSSAPTMRAATAPPRTSRPRPTGPIEIPAPIQIPPANLPPLRPLTDYMGPRPARVAPGATLVSPAAPAQPAPAGQRSYKASVTGCSKKIVEETLAASGGNVSEAARRLGLSRQSIYNIRQRPD